MFVVIKSSFMRILFGKSEEVLTYDGKLLNFNTKEEAQKFVDKIYNTDFYIKAI